MVRESDRSGEEPVMLSLRVPAALRDRLSAVAGQAGVTIQSIGRRALEVELETREAMLVDAVEREAEIRGRVRSEVAHLRT